VVLRAARLGAWRGRERRPRRTLVTFDEREQRRRAVLAREADRARAASERRSRVRRRGAHRDGDDVVLVARAEDVPDDLRAVARDRHDTLCLEDLLTARVDGAADERRDLCAREHPIIVPPSAAWWRRPERHPGAQLRLTSLRRP